MLNNIATLLIAAALVHGVGSLLFLKGWKHMQSIIPLTTATEFLKPGRLPRASNNKKQQTWWVRQLLIILILGVIVIISPAVGTALIIIDAVMAITSVIGLVVIAHLLLPSEVETKGGKKYTTADDMYIVRSLNINKDEKKVSYKGFKVYNQKTKKVTFIPKEKVK